MEELKALTLTFLQFMSGGEPSKLLEVCLTDSSKKELLSAGSGKTRWASLPSYGFCHVQTGQDQHLGEEGAAPEDLELPGAGRGEGQARGNSTAEGSLP